MTAAAQGEWRRAIDDEGFGGLLVITGATTVWDGIEVPMVSWQMPLYRVESLAAALELLDEIGTVTGARECGVDGYGWSEEVPALRAALDELVARGVAHWFGSPRTITAGPDPLPGLVRHG